MINSVVLINRFVKDNPKSFIEECEEAYHNEIRGIVNHIVGNKHLKIIMLAGPSGSGKTTTAHILRKHLDDNGVHTQVVSLDDFYKNRDALPVINGRTDAESVYALDLVELKFCLSKIAAFGKCNIPVFDFTTGKSIKAAQTIDISDDGVLIVEGLHALNPVITENLSKETLYKIYISVNNSINSSIGKELLSSRKIRLMRRAIRDERARGADITKTLKMWTQVVEGEEKYLYPYKKQADKILITLHPYEPCLYKEHFLQMMATVDKNAENYAYANSVVAALRNFEEINSDLIPENSLIREFIGGGKYN